MSRRAIEVADDEGFTGPTVDVIWTFEWVQMSGTIYSGKFDSVRSKSTQRGETLARQRLGRDIPKDKAEYERWEVEILAPTKQRILQELRKEFGDNVLLNLNFELTWKDRVALRKEQHKNKLRFDHARGKGNWYHTDTVLDGRGTMVRWCWMKHKNKAGFFLTWREKCPKNGGVWTRDQNSVKARRAKKAARAFADNQWSRAWKKMQERDGPIVSNVQIMDDEPVVEAPPAKVDPLVKARAAKAKKRDQHARRCEVLKKAREVKARKESGSSRQLVNR